MLIFQGVPLKGLRDMLVVPWRVWTRLREATYPGPKDTFEDYFPIKKGGIS